VLTVFMVMGAWRISTVNVLTRRAAAIEALGAATVLCSDKTGTLTENRMSIAEIMAGGVAWRIAGGPGAALPPAVRDVVEYGILSSDLDPFDPMERAFLELGRSRLNGRMRHHADYVLAGEYGLRSDLLAVTRAWRVPGQSLLTVATKGAPEAVATLARLPAAEVAAVKADADAMARRGMRVLGVARAVYTDGALPERPSGFAFEFLGLVGLADPLRPSVPGAVAECRDAGIRVVMITGDYPATAIAIAREAGILDRESDPARHVVSGEALAAMSDSALAARVKATLVFARIMPEQKLRIVEALKSQGEIVAMTGDGVNDAPSVKAAHIGIAMGGRGTDVAREASSIVLLDDDFGSIVKTARLGRRIYDNLRKAMGYVLAMHVPIAGLALVPLLFGWPLVLTPVHIAFLEMVIDPVCSIVFEAEPEEEDIMRRPPRDPESPLLSASLVGWYLLQGVLVLAVVVALYGVALARAMPEAEARALAFVALVATNVALIFVNRSHSASVWMALTRPNPWLWVVLGIVTAILAAALWLPPLARLFKFAPMHAAPLAAALMAGIAVVVVLDLVKPYWAGRLRA
jgi:Ca2+-transporting ATPase